MIRPSDVLVALVVSTFACAPVVIAERVLEPEPFRQTAYVKSPLTHTTDDFGQSIALTDELLVVGAPGSAATGSLFDLTGDFQLPNSGAISIYERTDDGLDDGRLLKAKEPHVGSSFGRSVAATDRTAIIVAPSEIGEDGFRHSAVHILDVDDPSNATKFGPDEPGAFDDLGRTADIASGTLVVGAPRCSAPTYRCTQGAVYVFAEDGSAWQPLEPLTGGSENGFGLSVAINAHTVVVGAPRDRSCAIGVDGDELDTGCPRAGAAYVFERQGDVWNRVAYLKSTTATTGMFGMAVAVHGEAIVVGAPEEGAAYTFERTDDGWISTERLVPDPPDSQTQFGAAVAIFGDRLVIGAPAELGCGVGVDPSPTLRGCLDDALVPIPGAAYLFVREDERWSLGHYLKASNTNGEGAFGTAVAVTPDAVVVGAPKEAGCALGLDGDDGDLFCPAAGAVYMFGGTVGVR